MSSRDVKLLANLGILKKDGFLTSKIQGKFEGRFVSLCLHPPFGILNRHADFERAVEILKFAWIKIHVHSSGFYHCKAPIVIYVYIGSQARDTRGKSSVENSFTESLYLQAGLYTCKNL